MSKNFTTTILVIILWASLLFPSLTSDSEVEAPLLPPDDASEEFLIKWHILHESERFGADFVLAKHIMQCESSHYGGAVNHNRREDGTIWSTDVGHWQVNDYYHEEAAANMGLDIHDTLENITYGFHLLTDGNDPSYYWGASEYCWGVIL